MRKIILILILIIAAAGAFVFLNKYKSRKTRTSSGQMSDTSNRILYYTGGMHPSVRVSVEEYDKGNTKCPICQMDLVPVYATPEAVSSDNKKTGQIKEKINIVSINPTELALVGVKTVEAKIIPLYKEIRTVGITAFDPELRTTEEEYIQALKTYEKVSQSGFDDAKERAKDIVEATRIKLELLGLDQASIQELEGSGQPDKSLILPDEYMWVYAHFYEYEIFWPRVGDKVVITSLADSAIELSGKIKSIEPVIKEKTRTERLKIIVANKGMILRPNMYVDVWLKSDLGPVLSIPKEAVLDTGKRKVIYVDLGQGRFQLRKVTVGPLAQGVLNGMKKDFYPLISGAEEGESIVSKGNFLIDSQSQLGAAASAFSGALGEEKPMPPGHNM